MGLGSSMPRGDGVTQDVPIEIPSRGRRALRSLPGKKSGGGSLVSALSVDIDGPEIMAIKKEQDMYRMKMESEIKIQAKKLEKVQSDYERLRNELQALQRTCNRLRVEREEAVKAEQQARRRAAFIESDRDKAQKNFKIFRETKEGEIQNLLRAKRALENKLNKVAPDQVHLPSYSLITPSSSSYPTPSSLFGIHAESGTGGEAGRHPDTNGVPEGTAEYEGGVEEEAGGSNSLLPQESLRADHSSLFNLDVTIIHKDLHSCFQDSCHGGVLRLYITHTRDLSAHLDTFVQEYVPKLRDIAESNGHFLVVSYLPEISSYKGFGLKQIRNLRNQLIYSSSLLVGFLGLQMSSYVIEDVNTGHLSSPGDRLAVFYLREKELGFGAGITVPPMTEEEGPGDDHGSHGVGPLSAAGDNLKSEIRRTGGAVLVSGGGGGGGGGGSGSGAPYALYEETKLLLKAEVARSLKRVGGAGGYGDCLSGDQSGGTVTGGWSSCEGRWRSAFPVVIYDEYSHTEHVTALYHAAQSNKDWGFDKFYERLNSHVAAAGFLPPLLISGGDGCGKSLLLAKWTQQQIARGSGNVVLYHFVGREESSSTDAVLMMRRLTAQLMSYAVCPPRLPSDSSQLIEEFPRWLDRVATNIPGAVILVIDGLDKFQHADSHLRWLLDPLPVDLRVLVSISESSTAPSWRLWPTLTLDPLTNKDVKLLLQHYFSKPPTSSSGHPFSSLISPLSLSPLSDSASVKLSSGGPIGTASLGGPIATAPQGLGPVQGCPGAGLHPPPPVPSYPIGTPQAGGGGSSGLVDGVRWRGLDSSTESKILTHCRTPSTCAPLYVMLLAAHMESCWENGEMMRTRLSQLLAASDTVELYMMILEYIREDVESPHNATKGTLMKVLKYLYASRDGLGDWELMDLLGGAMDWTLWGLLCGTLISHHVLMYRAGLLCFAHKQASETVRLHYFNDRGGRSLATTRARLVQYFSRSLHLPSLLHPHTLPLSPQAGLPPTSRWPPGGLGVGGRGREGGGPSKEVECRSGQITCRVAAELPWHLLQLGERGALQETLLTLPIFLRLYGRGRCNEIISYWQYLGVDKTQMAELYFNSIKEYESKLAAGECGEWEGEEEEEEDDGDFTSLTRAADAYEVLGSFLRDDVRLLSAATNPLQRALELREGELDPDHPRVGRSLHQLALLYTQWNKAGPAENCYRQALQIYEGAYGSSHPAVGSLLEALALLYQKQGRQEHAEPYRRRAAAIRSQQRTAALAAAGQGPPTARATNTGSQSAVSFHEGLRAGSQSANSFHEGLRAGSQSVTSFHGSVMAQMGGDGNCGIGSLNRSGGECEEEIEAEVEVNEKAVNKEREEGGSTEEGCFPLGDMTVGPDSPSLAKKLNELGVLYYSQGHYKSANIFLERALSMREKVLGENDSETAQSLYNLGGLYNQVKNYEKALPLYERALEIKQRCFRDDLEKIIPTVQSLALVYQKMERYAEAASLYRALVQNKEQAMGGENGLSSGDPSLALALSNLAIVYCQMSKHSEAGPLYGRALSIYEATLGPKHPRVAETLKNLALLNFEKGEFTTAAKLYKRATEIRMSNDDSSCTVISFDKDSSSTGGRSGEDRSLIKASLTTTSPNG